MSVPGNPKSMSTTTRPSGSRKGGSARTASSNTLNSAVFTPMGSASIRIATTAKPGLRARVLKASLMSCSRESILHPSFHSQIPCQ